MTTNLKELRKASGLTGTQVGELMGTSQPNVSIFESGRHTPRVDTLARYFTAVGRDDLVRPLLNRLTAAQLLEVNRIRARRDDLAETLPPYYRDLLRSGGNRTDWG